MVVSEKMNGFEVVAAQDDLLNIYRLARKKRYGRWKVKFNGLSIYCHDLLSFYMAAKDIFLQRIYEFKCDSAEPTVIDGGGHIGLFTLMVKKLYPDARITVFEPDHESLYLLRKNISENKLKGVEVVEAGLFNRDGEIAFNSDHSDGSSISRGEGASSICVTSLRPFLEKGVDFLKLNIEGAELEVLSDCQDLLPEIRQIVIEYHGFPEIGQRLHEILAILDRSGFRYMVHDFDKITNPATKPPFSLSERSRYFLIIYAVKLFSAKQLMVQRADNEFLSEPVSRKFGFDRGIPIDRYYIDKFLALNADCIHGRVMEVAGKTYSEKYGCNIQSITVLSVEPGLGVDLVGNLTTGENIPRAEYDCIILTQTLQMIFDIRSALKYAYAALKPGGSMLLTISGISQISRYDMDKWGEFWRLTDKGLRSLLVELEPKAEIDIVTYGNVAVAKAFLDGFACEDLPETIFDVNDPDYQLLVASRVSKPDCKTSQTKIISEAKKDSMVLIYHRVAEDPIDRNLLAVSPENFEKHLKILSENFRVIPLWEFLSELDEGRLVPGTISLTFDDGYLDNLTNAVPFLEKYGLHATIFVTSGMVGSSHEFWWDAMERIFLSDEQKCLPEQIVFEDQQGVERGWKTVTWKERLRAYDEICSILRNNSVQEINLFLEKLFVWAGGRRLPRASHMIVDQKQLRTLASSSVIEIGAHTVNHSRLCRLSIVDQKKEIEDSKKQLEAIIHKPVKIFSYPYGGGSDFSLETKKIVEECGFEYGIANIQKDIVLPVDKFEVSRRLVRDWGAEEFRLWLMGCGHDRDKLEIATRSEKIASISKMNLGIDGRR